MLLVVSVIVAARLRAHGRRREDRRARPSGSCAGSRAAAARPAAATPGRDGPDEGDLEGPPLSRTHRSTVLPFPGSVTITCTYDKRAPETCMPKGGTGVSVQASGELKVERTPTTLDANGCPWQNLSIQARR